MQGDESTGKDEGEVKSTPSIDNSHYRLISKLGKGMQINHHS
jgi:hypothetical protein